jgi:ribonuclease D
MDAEWIETPARLDELVRHLRTAGRFGFDTEFVSEETFEPNLCLVQVASEDRIANVDPMAPGMDRAMEGFWGLVLDPSIEIVMHAAGEDLRIAQFLTGRLPDRVYDVQLGAGLVGYGYPISLSNLVRHELGVSLAGSETRTDWRRRPLTDAQLDYASDDVRYLLPLADRLGSRLAEWNRAEWAEAEFARLIENVEARDDAERWRRLPGLHQLSRRGLEAARRLAGWRVEQARASNRPLRQLLRDDLLVAIAKRQPASRRDLEALRDFNRPQLLARTNDILAVVAQAREVPDRDLPDHAERREEGPGAAMVVSLLSASLHQCCTERHVASSLVGSVSDLKDLIAWQTTGRSEDRRPWLAKGWRGEVCGRLLTDVLAGRRSLRIVDPMAEVPIAVEPVDGETSDETGCSA